MQQITQKRAISPIIATLLLILIAIAAGTLVYAYVIGFIGSSTQNSGSGTGTLNVSPLGITGGAALANNAVNAFVSNVGSITEAFSVSTGGLVSAYLKSGGTVAQQLQLSVNVVATSTWTKGGIPGSITVTISSNQVTVGYMCSSCNDMGTIVATFMGASTTITGGTATAGTAQTIGGTFSTNPTVTLVPVSVPSLSNGQTANLLVTLSSSATITLPVGATLEFTMAPQSSGSVIVSGTTYTLQVVANDATQVQGSAKAA